MSGIPLPEFITVYNFVYISDVITWFTLYSGSVSLNSSTSLSIYSPSSPVNGVQNSTASSSPPQAANMNIKSKLNKGIKSFFLLISSPLFFMRLTAPPIMRLHLVLHNSLFTLYNRLAILSITLMDNSVYIRTSYGFDIFSVVNHVGSNTKKR